MTSGNEEQKQANDNLLFSVRPPSFLHSSQGRIFLAGCCMLVVWIAGVAYLWRFNVSIWNDILTIGFAHVLAGRAISIARGTYVGLPKWLIVMLAVYADTTVMLILFPLFVWSYEHIAGGRFLQQRMRPMLESAERNMDRFGRYKIAGVFFFVWIPLWMTGIIAGAILGHLLGLRAWVTIVTVIAGAFAAVVSWVYAYDIVFKLLSRIHQDIAMFLVVAVFVGLLIYRFYRRRRIGRRNNHGNHA